MFSADVIADLTNLGAAGVMGAMWLWERRASRQREEELTEAHARIVRDEERLSKLVDVVEHNTAALARFNETQQSVRQVLAELKEEINHAHQT